jgi:hypothetical protein
MRDAFKAFMPPTDLLDLWPDKDRPCDAGFDGAKLSMPIYVQGSALDTRDTLFYRLSQQPGFEQAPTSYVIGHGASRLTVVVAFSPDGVNNKLAGGYQRFTSLHALDNDFVRSSPLLNKALARCAQWSLSTATSPLWALLLNEFGNGGDDISLLGGAAPLTKAEFLRHVRFCKGVLSELAALSGYDAVARLPDGTQLDSAKVEIRLKHVAASIERDIHRAMLTYAVTRQRTARAAEAAAAAAVQQPHQNNALIGAAGAHNAIVVAAGAPPPPPPAEERPTRVRAAPSRLKPGEYDSCSPGGKRGHTASEGNAGLLTKALKKKKPTSGGGAAGGSSSAALSSNVGELQAQVKQLTETITDLNESKDKLKLEKLELERELVEKDRQIRQLEAAARLPKKARA